MHTYNAFANTSDGLAKGSLAPVEKVSQSDLGALHNAEIGAIVSKYRAIKSVKNSIASASASPVLTSLGRLKRTAPTVSRVNNPKLISLSEVSHYVAGLSLLPEPSALPELHASVEVLTPLSHFDIVSSLAIDIRVSSLAPLRGYSIWDSLVIDPRADLASLVKLESAPSIFIDRRATILTPITNFGFASEDEAIEYVTLADADSGFSRSKLYLSNYRGSVGTKAFYDDNIFSSSSEQQGSFVLLNNLLGSATLQRGRSSLTLNYTYSDGRFEASPDDNYSDGKFNVSFDQKFAKTQSLSVSGNQSTTHEARGTGVAEGEGSEGISEPLEAKRDNLVVVHSYGTAEGLQLVNTVGYNSLEYASSPELTNAREYTELSFNNSSKYSLGARTKLSVGVTASEVDYRFDPLAVAGAVDTLDSKTRAILAGFERNIGRRSLGRFSYGTIDRSFLDADRESSRSGYWDAEFVWGPRSYSKVTLGVRRNYLESKGVGDFIDSRETKVAWAHAWAKRLSTQFNAQYTDDKYIGSERQDKRLNLGLRVTYKFNNRLSLVSGGRYSEQKSEGTDFDFKRKVLFIESNFRL